MIRIMRLGSIVLCLLALSGCTLEMWKNNQVIEKEPVKNIVMTDSVISFFRYQDLKITAKAGDKGQVISLPQQGIGFLGENNIYFLTKGEKRLLALNEHINQFPFVSANSSDSIPLELIKSDNPNVKGNFIETYYVTVDKPKQNLSDREIKTLDELGFRYNGLAYTTSIMIEGVILDRASLDLALHPQQELNRNYKITLYTTGYESHFNAGNLVANTVVTPLMVVGDIVFLPMFVGLMMAISH